MDKGMVNMKCECLHCKYDDNINGFKSIFEFVNDNPNDKYDMSAICKECGTKITGNQYLTFIMLLNENDGDKRVKGSIKLFKSIIRSFLTNINAIGLVDIE